MNAAQTECTLDTPESIGAMEFVIGMITDKIAAPVTDLANPSFAVEEFFGGKIGMHVDGPWQFINIRRTPTSSSGTLRRMPAGPAGSVTWAAGSGFGISNTTENPDAAWTALKTITSTASLEKLVEAGRGYPARESAVSTFEKPPPQNVDVVQKILVSDIGEARPFVTTTTWQETTVMLARDFSPVFLGKQSVDAVVQGQTAVRQAPCGEPGDPRAAVVEQEEVPWLARATRAGKVPWKDREHEGLAAGLFLLPNLIGFLSSRPYPLARLSSSRSTITTCCQLGGGLENFRELPVDRVFRAALFNTVYFTAVSVPLSVVLGLATAILVNQALRGVVIFRSIFLLPYVTVTVALSLVWKWLYLPDIGLINSVLGAVGIDGPAWLTSQIWAMPALILMSVWKGFNMVIFLAGLQGIPDHLYDAAKVDGATAWRRFLNVTLPLLSPTTFFVVVISVISSSRSSTRP